MLSAVAVSKSEGEAAGETPVRRRILEAAFSAFMEAGYTETSTLEIAKRARVSKRELYALVGNKQEMLAACIRERAERMQAPAELPEPRDRQTLERALVAFGTQLLSETTNPTVIAVFRLAIAEAVRAPEVARTLDSFGRQTGRAALTSIMDKAKAHGLLNGSPPEMAEQFAGLLWGDLMISLLLRTADSPDPEEITRRARSAATAFLQAFIGAGQSG
ncbi:AcrR family transcriptional regulator [Thermocatellispora tengchongensis]|uniref:AcrR family transcriptional regulator n=1 Tax=Thermocatellispora tengchongensis TaxID=1073253 RepID=A0A840PFJ8_9ACTN|nr:TetR/AcrR family transcriptional regulator [Thermocatellispora tengchongensis]MBB5137546.1 AcrR family transcriptional regulator [Thermocatellispora tengchongensis]